MLNRFRRNRRKLIVRRGQLLLGFNSVGNTLILIQARVSSPNITNQSINGISRNVDILEGAIAIVYSIVDTINSIDATPVVALIRVFLVGLGGIVCDLCTIKLVSTNLLQRLLFAHNLPHGCLDPSLVVGHG